MRVLVQWSRLNPKGWETSQSEDWVRTPVKSVSPPRELDDSPGWVHAKCIQGVVFTGVDHYATEHISDDEIREYAWCDDPIDYPDGEKYAHVWTFRKLAPDPEFGGAYNTRQIKKVYAQRGPAWDRHIRAGLIPGVNLFEWADFVPPPTQIIRHGVKVAGQQHRAHEAKRGRRGWREWTDGVPTSEITNGRVRDQRKIGRYNRPDGTLTYYHNATALATGIHKADHENELGASAAGLANESASIAKKSEELAFCATTPANEPNSAAWPIGTYRCQIDCQAAGADITYGLLTIGSADGHFARVNTGLTADLETKTQTDGAYSGTGLKLASTGSVPWTGGDATDRFEVLIAAGNANTGSAQSLALDLGEADDFADGPWTAELTADAAVADAQGVGLAATVTLGPTKNVDAGVADAQGQAVSPTVTNGPELTADAAVADAQGQAVSPTVVSTALTAAVAVAVAVASSISPTVVNGPEQTADAAVADAQAQALSPTVEKEITADAVVASAVGTANAATVTKETEKTSDAAVASGVGTANAATVTNGPEKTADAAASSATATANAATVEKEITADAAVASAMGASAAATVTKGPEKTADAAAASATAISNSPTVISQELTADAAASSATGTAGDATVVNGPEKTADAAIVSATGTASSATVTKGPEKAVDAAIVSAAATANPATVVNGPEKAVDAAPASATGTALSATAEIVSFEQTADAAVASATSTALPATAHVIGSITKYKPIITSVIESAPSMIGMKKE